jgi:hypothetical protein
MDTPKPNDPFRLTSSGAFPKDSIQNYPEDEDSPTGYPFFKGPFYEGLADEDSEIDPYLYGVDYTADGTRTFNTIVSCAGRMPDHPVSSAILYEIAEKGGWDGDSAWQEYGSGGADILTDYSCKEIASGLLNELGRVEGNLIVEEKEIEREIVWKAYVIFNGGPTLIPW